MSVQLKEFEYYVVFQDSKKNYVIAYGYEEKPAIIDLKFAFEQLVKEPDLIAAIPDFTKIVDYVLVDIMKHEKFVKYMAKQEEKADIAEKKKDKK